MNLSIEELEIIKKKSFQEGYDKGYKIGFENGYEQGVDYSDSCLVARIEELEEELKAESEDFPQAKDIEPTVESFKRTMDNVDKLMPEEKETDIGKAEREDK